MEIVVAIAVAWWAWNHFVNQISSDFVILNYQYVCLKNLHTDKKRIMEYNFIFSINLLFLILVSNFKIYQGNL